MVWPVSCYSTIHWRAGSASKRAQQDENGALLMELTMV
jgi:hypothetical protein